MRGSRAQPVLRLWEDARAENTCHQIARANRRRGAEGQVNQRILLTKARLDLSDPRGMNKRLCICVALHFGLLHAVAHAQPNVEARPGSPNATVFPDLRDRPEGLIKLDLMVTDTTGKPAAGLNSSDFRLVEEGREQKILSFQAFTGRGAGTEPPVKIILMIDTLEVPPKLARNERNAVTFFLRKDGGHLARPTSVFLLSETGLWTTNPSPDGNTLAKEVEHNEFSVVRGNSVWQRGPAAPPRIAVSEESAALKALGRIATDERQMPGRKLLLWVGPGWGIGSGSAGDARHEPGLFGSVCWFSTLLREAHLALFSFSIGEMDPRGQLYKDHLAGVRLPDRASSLDLDRKVLAVQSGGRVIEPGEDIEEEIEKCVQEAGPFYRISFDPFSAEHLSEYHDLKVEVDEPGLNVRTNAGYYDQPYYSVDQIPPLKRLSLEELQKLVEADESDTAKASQLTGCELTERLSEQRLASLYAIAHGKRTREQLRILADASSFLAPPRDEIPKAPPPNVDEQQHMLSMMSAYLATAVHKLPDYFARRITTRYQETAMNLESGVHYKPIHRTDSSMTTVRYRNGREDTDTKAHWLRLGSPELITVGVFGPALRGVLEVITKNGPLTWIRWEQVTAGRAAVFRSTIPVDESLRYIWGCCTPDGDGNQAFQRYAGYHIEIAIDPGSGAILRLCFQFDLKSTTPFTRSDIMIEYGRVEIGGTSYYCPLRSVSIDRARSVRVLSDGDESFRSYGPYATMLNDISFDRYHMFRSESRILTGFTPTEK
jgi:VWFA-related protein